MSEDLIVLIRGLIVLAVGGSPKVFPDRPVGNVTGLPRYCIIGPLSNDTAEYIGEDFTSSKKGAIHSLTYDIEVWSKDNKEATVQTDKIVAYFLANRGELESSGVLNLEIVGQNPIFEQEVKIHRKITTIRITYYNER